MFAESLISASFMTWIAFKDKKPLEDKFLITRHPGETRDANGFETWHLWKDENLKICNINSGKGCISHWWDGPQDFDLAIDNWFSDSAFL